jgi:predicted nucleotidyltransferase
MVTAPRLDAVLAALTQLPAVKVVTLFGSRARGAGDSASDIDLQIITRQPAQFENSSWLSSDVGSVLAYGLRPAFGGVTKATIVFEGGEIDLVVLPYGRLLLARGLVRVGLHRRSVSFRRALQDLAIVLRPGYRVLRGGDGWSRFFARVVSEVPDRCLSDGEVRRMADCAYADFVSLQRKVKRGELIAAQRWLHLHLVETNLKLIYEHCVRCGRPIHHDARRVEWMLQPEEQAMLRATAHPSAADLLAAAQHAIATTAKMVSLLTGAAPGWAHRL